MLVNYQHRIGIGGQNKEELLASLAANSVQLNQYAHMLFDHRRFETSEQSRSVIVTILTVAELGFSSGATSDDIFASAGASGFDLCPIELAAHFRLQYLEQPDGPYITVASAKICNDAAFPNGFYLRRLDGTLWLRGYRASTDYVWEPASRFAFLVP